MKSVITTVSALLLTFFLTNCGPRSPVGSKADARYVDDGSEEGLVNLDKINSQDFTRAANKLLQDLYTSGALVKAPAQPAVLHVGRIRNDTQSYFDVDLLLQSMKRDLISSNRVKISTTEGPGGIGADEYAKDVRKKLELTDDPKVNRPRPYFSLSGKIIEETSRVEKVTQKDFYFLLTLTELDSGTGVWFGRELITKQGRRGAIGF